MQHTGQTQHSEENHYLRLVGMTVLSFISMYALMYSMANSFKDLCKTIISGQRSELDHMRALLQEKSSAR